MKKILLICFSFLLISVVSAEEIKDLSRYEDITQIKVEGILTPKVVKFTTNEDFYGQTLLLNDKDEVISHNWIRKNENIKKIKISNIEPSSVFEGTIYNLTDNNLNTNFAFTPEKDEENKLVINFSEKTEVSGIKIFLDNGIISPKTINVRAKIKGDEWSTIIKDVSFERRISFPKISVTALELSFDTKHFLRLSDIEIIGKEESLKRNELVFFAEEGKEYTLYFNSNFGQKSYSAKKYQPLQTDLKTPTFTLPNLSENNLLFNDDFDNDGIKDSEDLCPKLFDSENTDIDKNGRGDFCEDPDLDNKMSNIDNCPYHYNPNQSDEDVDGIGDECDDEENRESENMQYLLYFVFFGASMMLLFLVVRSMKK